jgi:hypothetical protein
MSENNMEWAQSHDCISKYVFNRRAPKPKISYLRGFFTWTKENHGYEPCELIEYQLSCEREALDNRDPRKKYVITGYLSDYLRSLSGKRTSYKQNIASCVYTLFNVNRIPLPKDEEVKRATKYNSIRKVNKDKWVTVENLWNLRKMVDGNTNPLYRVVYLAMFSSGMGIDEIVEWRNKGVEYTRTMLEKGLYGKKIFRIDLEPRKNLTKRFNYHTYIYAKDTIKALEEWLEFRNQKGYTNQALIVTKNDALLTQNALGKAFLCRARKLGIYTTIGNSDVGNRYGWSPHIIRSFFKTWMWKCTAPNWIADAMMGYGVDSNEYMRLFNDDAWRIEQLFQAEPWFNIISSTIPFDLESKNNISLIQQEQNSRVTELEIQITQLSKALTKVMAQIETSDDNLSD